MSLTLAGASSPARHIVGAAFQPRWERWDNHHKSRQEWRSYNGQQQAGLRRLVLITVLMLGGCASQPAVFHYNLTDSQRVWPSAPETPRYEYVGQLIGEQNFESSASGLRKAGRTVLKWLVGLGFAGPDGPVELQRPQSGVVDGQGRIYVTDVSRQAVYVFDQPRGTLEVWEMAAENRRFLSPIGIALGQNNEILVADSELGRVARLDAQGQPVGTFGDELLSRPTGLARDAASGRIYVADTDKHHIVVFNDQGEHIDTLGGPGNAPGQFNRPTHLYLNHQRLYVSDTLNARIQVLGLDGEPLEVFGKRGVFVGDTPRPKGVASDNEGNIYVVESYYDYLLVFNSKGDFLLPIGGTGNTIGRFNLPAGVWTDQQQRIYVADMFNGRVVIFRYLGGA